MLADSAHIQEKDAEFLARRGKEAHRAAVLAPPQHANDRAHDAVFRIGDRSMSFREFARRSSTLATSSAQRR